MAKSIFRNYHVVNIKKAKKKCINYECISFDVFDTLIKRNLNSPKDLFWILDRKATELDIENFMNLRINTERKLRENQSYVKLDEIYVEISNVIGNVNATKLKELEIKLELSYCQRNNEIFELYKYLKENGKKVIAISDMYLSSDTINSILVKAGIIVDSLYVSCECNSKKTDGSLFNHVISKENIDKRKIIHIGDNWKADYLGAKTVGVEAIHIKRKNKMYNSNRFIKDIDNKNKYNTYISIINNNLSTQNNYYKKFGFAVLGPLVYNYCEWLKNECKKQNLKQIYFFSRDGYVLKKSFDTLYPNEFDTKYIYFSRRAIRIPYISIYSSYEEIMKFFPKTKMLTMKVYFENFGLNPNKYIKLLDKYELNLEDNIYYDDLFIDSKYKMLFDEIHKDIINESNKEFEIFKKYLKQENFSDEIAIVDVGWHNSMQFYLENIATHDKLNINMHGFYIGRLKGEKKVKATKSFIIDDFNQEYAETTLSFIGLIESVFLANEGSTKKYAQHNNKIVPVLLDYEYCKTDIEYTAFKDIRDGINNFINLVSNLDCFNFFHLNGYDSYLALKTFGTNPYLKDVSYFSKFRYLSEEIVYFSNAKSILFYIFHIKELKKDLYKARWKIGFMKELLKIKLPYYKIYKRLRG